MAAGYPLKASNINKIKRLNDMHAEIPIVNQPSDHMGQGSKVIDQHIELTVVIKSTSSFSQSNVQVTV